MSCSLSRRSSLVAVCTALLGAAAFAAPPTRVSANDLAFEHAARGVAKGQQLVVEGLLLETESGTSVLELERIEVWRADAVVLVDNRRVSVPKTVYFRGKLAGEPDSAVLLSVREKGGVRACVQERRRLGDRQGHVAGRAALEEGRPDS